MPFLLKPGFRIQISKYRIFKLQFQAENTEESSPLRPVPRPDRALQGEAVRHSLRTKRPVVRHINALKQQEKRRRRNTNVATETSQSSTSPTLIRTASARKSTSCNAGGTFLRISNLDLGFEYKT